nr:AadS family aminoglycoside 6-adenylyltransferase [Pedobacter panaciterrae]
MVTARNEKLKHIINWASAYPGIRAVLLTSSLASAIAPVDEFSDLDIEFVLEDLNSFLKDDNWLSEFGRVIAKVAEGEEAFEGKHAMRMVLYEDHVKVDFKLYNLHEFQKEAAQSELPEDWDVGYKVLVDKDRLCTNLKPATYQSVTIKKPDAKEFAQVMNDFWWDMTYVAKCLARDEIFYAKFMTENMMRNDYLVPMIEWHIALSYDWNITTNKHGRLFKKYLSSELWQKIEATFASAEIRDNWRALFAYADIGHELGTELAEKLGYQYPFLLEKDIRNYLNIIKTGKELR